MKNLILKSAMGCIGLFALITNITSCSGPKKEDSEDIAEEHNEAKFDKPMEKDAEFLVEAALINMTEIELSKLAETKAVSENIKTFAKTMIEDHTKLSNEVKSLASKKMITLPDSINNEGRKEYNKLSEQETGKDFEKKYCEMMVDGHKDAIKKFEKASSDASDMEIKEWATKALPALRTHLDKAMSIEKGTDEKSSAEKSSDKKDEKHNDKKHN